MSRTRGPSASVVALALIALAGCADAGWGPLAVVPSTGDDARTEGTLRITEDCVFLEGRGERGLLVWPADRTTWNRDEGTIGFQRPGGHEVILESGQAVVLGGGGSHVAEDGLAGERWVASVEWIQEPAEECVTDGRWFVSDAS